MILYLARSFYEVDIFIWIYKWTFIRDLKEQDKFFFHKFGVYLY